MLPPPPPAITSVRLLYVMCVSTVQSAKPDDIHKQ